jgi:hypothetical protein
MAASMLTQPTEDVAVFGKAIGGLVGVIPFKASSSVWPWLRQTHATRSELPTSASMRALIRSVGTASPADYRRRAQAGCVGAITSLERRDVVCGL